MPSAGESMMAPSVAAPSNPRAFDRNPVCWSDRCPVCWSVVNPGLLIQYRRLLQVASDPVSGPIPSAHQPGGVVSQSFDDRCVGPRHEELRAEREDGGVTHAYALISRIEDAVIVDGGELASATGTDAYKGSFLLEQLLRRGPDQGLALEGLSPAHGWIVDEEAPAIDVCLAVPDMGDLR